MLNPCRAGNPATLTTEASSRVVSASASLFAGEELVDLVLDFLEIHERPVHRGEANVRHLVQAAEIVRASADKDANIIFGTVIDEKMSGEVKITVVATGFVVGAETSREIEEQYSRPAPVDDAPVYKGFDPSNLDIPAFLRGRR